MAAKKASPLFLPAAIFALAAFVVILYTLRDEKLAEDQRLTGFESRECIPTPAQAEGPYYKAGSPERNNIALDITGKKLIITGQVLDSSCNPVPGAWLDFWQADTSGDYDLRGYNFRGHQFADNQGNFRLETILPAQYGTRPAHVHFKARAGQGPIFTSQIYFPGDTQNTADSLFDNRLLLQVTSQNGEIRGTFNIVLP